MSKYWTSIEQMEKWAPGNPEDPFNNIFKNLGDGINTFQKIIKLKFRNMEPSSFTHIKGFRILETWHVGQSPYLLTHDIFYEIE